MATHEEWKAALEIRDGLARLTVQALVNGDAERALKLALESDAADEEMHRISRILDGPDDEES